MDDNMTQTTYEFPLPNNGERYDLSQQELCDLLSKAYYKGFKDGQDSVPAHTTSSDHTYYNPTTGIYHLCYTKTK